MRKVSEIREQLIAENEAAINTIEESNKYLDFAKQYHKKHGVSGPFDAKFKGNKKEQEKYMEELGKAWSDYKKEHGIVTKKSNYGKK
jgi:hypothetical protein